jgi:4-hydroxy-3-methylbut-2-enyl diphosphate reductase
VDNASELQSEWLQDKHRIGVTAGASAPDILVQGVIARLQALGANSVTSLDGIEETVNFPLPKALQD